MLVLREIFKITANYTFIYFRGICPFGWFFIDFETWAAEQHSNLHFILFYGRSLLTFNEKEIRIKIINEFLFKTTVFYFYS